MNEQIQGGGPLTEGMPPSLEDVGAPDPVSPMGNHTVPLSALAMPDDQEQMTDPEVGDTVSYTVEGVVESLDAGLAQVKPTAVNGEPLEAPAPEDGGIDELRSMAQQLPI